MPNLSAWGNRYSISQRLKVSSLLMKISYSIQDYSIQFSEPIESTMRPFKYDAKEIFQILDMALSKLDNFSTKVDGSSPVAVNRRSFTGMTPMSFRPMWLQNTQYYNESQSLAIMLALEVGAGDGSVQRKANLETQLFHNLLTLPLYTFNVGMMTPYETPYPDNFRTTGYYTRSIYRILIADYSLYLFSGLAIGALVWCGIVLSYCWRQPRHVPNLSAFPELDFATKYVAGSSYSLQGLGNAGTRETVNKITGKIFVGAARDSDEMTTPIIFSVDGNVDALRTKQLYT
jgi:hypothetical protein